MQKQLGMVITEYSQYTTTILKEHMNFTTEKDLESYIRNNTLEIFGEDIEWHDSWRNLPGDSGSSIRADLVGKGNNYDVIAEVKLLRPHSDRKYDLAREAVGQVLHYAFAFTQKLVETSPLLSFHKPNIVKDVIAEEKALSYNLRLFIVGEEFSQPVENICQLLRAYGIDITHIYIGQT